MQAVDHVSANPNARHVMAMQTMAGNAAVVHVLRQVARPKAKSGKKHAATTGAWEFVRRMKDGGETPQVDRARIGDRLVARLKFDGDAKSLGSETVGVSGLKEFVSAGGKWIDPRTFEYTVEAAQIGTANLAFDVEIPTLPHFKITVHADVEMELQRFINLTSEANTKVDNGYKSAKKWFLGLCIAYGTAYKRHTDALKDQADTERIAQELILGAVLAFIPGGAGGLVGAAMKRKQAGDFMIDGVKDLAKFGLRSTAQVGIRGGSPGGGGAGLTSFPTDPLQWRNEVETNVEDESLKIGQQLETWQHKANVQDPTFALNFNPVDAVAAALKIAGTSLESLPSIDHADTADDFERGMWATWLEEFGYIIVMKDTMFHGLEDSPAYNVGKKVKDRCESLGIDVDKYAQIARNRKQAEADATNRKRNPKWYGP